MPTSITSSKVFDLEEEEGIERRWPQKEREIGGKEGGKKEEGREGSGWDLWWRPTDQLQRPVGATNIARFC